MPNDTNSIGSSILAGLPVLGGIASSVANAVTSNAADTRSRHMYWDSYNRSRTDALADWNMQNEYNSPASQMERLKAAGLNPNLVYGNGATATTNSQVRSASGTSYQPSKPQIDLQTPFMGYIDARYKQTITNNIATLEDLNKARILTEIEKARKEAASAASLRSSGKYTDLKIARYDEIINTSLQGMKIDQQKKLADTQFTIDENLRQWGMQGINFANAVLKAAGQALENEMNPLKRQKMQQEINLLQKNNTLKQWEVELSKKNIRPGDPYWLRIGSSIIEKLKSGDVPGAKRGEVPVLPGVPFADWMARMSQWINGD